MSAAIGNKIMELSVWAANWWRHATPMEFGVTIVVGLIFFYVLMIKSPTEIERK